MAETFSKRIPADVNLAIARAAAEADQYISQYNIWMYPVDSRGQRLFAPRLRLLGVEALLPGRSLARVQGK